MQMDEGSWEDRLHITFIGEHVLFPGLRLDSWGHFFLAVLLTVVLCLSERLLTLTLTRHWAPFRYVRRSRLRTALWRTVLYWIVTLLRLLYMLISMTFHIGLIFILVTALSVGQFCIECVGEQPLSPNYEHAYRLDSDPLLRSAQSSTSLDESHPSSTRSRAKSRSKPSSIFIHPNDSNIARADAAAVEMGIHGDTDRVRVSNNYPDEHSSAWEHGKGRDMARDLLLGGVKQHSRSGSRQALFRIEDADSEDGDRDEMNKP